MKKRRAQKDNRSPGPHGYYAQVLSEAESLELEEAAGIDGLDGEIAFLRFKLRQILESNPERVDLQMKAVDMLARLIRTRYNTTDEDRKSLKEAINTVLTEVAIPLGLKFIPY